jgi:hypothetical protein
MRKVLKAFRFDPRLYAGFKGVVERSGLMVTEAFEKFMKACVEAGAGGFLMWEGREAGLRLKREFCRVGLGRGRLHIG